MEGQWNWTALPGDDEAVVAEGEVSESGLDSGGDGLWAEVLE